MELLFFFQFLHSDRVFVSLCLCLGKFVASTCVPLPCPGLYQVDMGLVSRNQKLGFGEGYRKLLQSILFVVIFVVVVVVVDQRCGFLQDLKQQRRILL